MADNARGFPVTLESWGWSQKGDIRPENQDSFLSWNERLLWAVADGVGSSAHGGEASGWLPACCSQRPMPPRWTSM